MKIGTLALSASFPSSLPSYLKRQQLRVILVWRKDAYSLYTKWPNPLWNLRFMSTV